MNFMYKSLRIYFETKPKRMGKTYQWCFDNTTIYDVLESYDMSFDYFLKNLSSNFSTPCGINLNCFYRIYEIFSSKLKLYFGSKSDFCGVRFSSKFCITYVTLKNFGLGGTVPVTYELFRCQQKKLLI